MMSITSIRGFHLGSSDRSIPAVLWPTRAFDRADSRTAADLSDDELMARVQGSDQAAFAIIMRRHARAVLAVGRRVLHDQGAAEELVQDVFLLIYKRSALFDPQRGSLRAWLIQIAYHEAYRTRQRLSLRHIYEDKTIDNCLEVIESAATPEYHAFLAQSEQNLRQAFRQLSKKQQETMELFFFEGYTLREISERLGDSLGNVRHYYYRALKEIKDIIGRDDLKIASHHAS
jgi:RNA polymerase sigma-70 factor, ECF subfamily